MRFHILHVWADTLKAIRTTVEFSPYYLHYEPGIVQSGRMQLWNELECSLRDSPTKTHMRSHIARAFHRMDMKARTEYQKEDISSKTLQNKQIKKSESIIERSSNNLTSLTPLEHHFIFHSLKKPGSPTPSLKPNQTSCLILYGPTLTLHWCPLGTQPLFFSPTD